MYFGRVTRASAMPARRVETTVAKLRTRDKRGKTQRECRAAVLNAVGLDRFVMDELARC